ncbi:2732_t:CDS:2, partial [Ambispora gerdemannii]
VAENSFSIPAMKKKDARLCHLSLGYSSFYKPSLLDCDSSNCFTTNIITTEETGRLVCELTDEEREESSENSTHVADTVFIKLGELLESQKESTEILGDLSEEFKK